MGVETGVGFAEPEPEPEPEPELFVFMDAEAETVGGGKETRFLALGVAVEVADGVGVVGVMTAGVGVSGDAAVSMDVGAGTADAPLFPVDGDDEGASVLVLLWSVAGTARGVAGPASMSTSLSLRPLTPPVPPALVLRACFPAPAPTPPLPLPLALRTCPPPFVFAFPPFVPFPFPPLAPTFPPLLFPATRFPGGTARIANSCAPGIGGGRKLELGLGNGDALGGVSIVSESDG
ncbi:hypothetical protein DFH08DRAFT_100263 [Mycena albidolilacea]|uniref:Uncharacterized protein n=1 Tax=Mycena albidolilacea TaxID=1033008 RepID=A0AAD7EVJ4_9AGAR|nr:hypothetical protein DFH08DRAFT_100263 [Mycena albidolilacea]